MLEKTKGIVLHHINYGESGIVTHIYTETRGRQSYLINGVRKQKSRKKLNLFQALSIVEMVIYHKPGRELNHIKEIRPALLYQSLPFDHIKSSIGLLLAEILHKLLKEEESNQDLFDFLVNSLAFLDEMNTKTANFHIVFLMQLARYTGIYPINNWSANNPVFDLLNGQFTTHQPMHPFFASHDMSYLLSLVMQTSYEKMNELTISGTERAGLLEIILQYYNLHFESLANIKSLDVLKSIFN